MDMLNAFMSIVSDLGDDLYLLSTLKVLDKKWEPIGEFLGVNVWFFCIIMDFTSAAFSAYDNFSRANIVRKNIRNSEDGVVKDEDLKKLAKFENDTIDKVL